jgi:hypothetical protein
MERIDLGNNITPWNCPNRRTVNPYGHSTPKRKLAFKNNRTHFRFKIYPEKGKWARRKFIRKKTAKSADAVTRNSGGY